MTDKCNEKYYCHILSTQTFPFLPKKKHPNGKSRNPIYGFKFIGYLIARITALREGKKETNNFNKNDDGNSHAQDALVEDKRN